MEIALENRKLIEEWEIDSKLRKMSPGTIYTHCSRIQRFAAFIGKVSLLDVTKTHIRRFIESRCDNISYGTLSGDLTAIANFYNWAIFEELVEVNPVTVIRKRYLQRYKKDSEKHTHKLISIADARRLVDAQIDIRDKAIFLLMFKTGVRRGELLSMEVGDIDWQNQSIALKRTAKRSNRIVFFDDETAFVLRRWLSVRQGRADDSDALWITSWGKPITRKAIERIFYLTATRTGLHDPDSDQMEDHFSPHCCRHWFTTHLRRAGMPREFIQELRGDVRKEAIDIYDHIDKEELRRSYLSHIPQLGV